MLVANCQYEHFFVDDSSTNKYGNRLVGRLRLAGANRARETMDELTDESEQSSVANR
jgi:hypothetical protein